MDMLRRGAARVASLGSSDDFIGRDVQVGTAVVRIRSVIAEGECPPSLFPTDCSCHFVENVCVSEREGESVCVFVV